MVSIGKTVTEAGGPIIGGVLLIIFLVVLGGIALLSTGTSNAVASTVTVFNDLLVIIGVASGFGLAFLALDRLG